MRAKQGCYRDWQGHTPFVSIESRTVESQVDLDLGLSVAETIERKIQGVERKYWNYCQISTIA
jgi:hypothetical protein